MVKQILQFITVQVCKIALIWAWLAIFGNWKERKGMKKSFFTPPLGTRQKTQCAIGRLRFFLCILIIETFPVHLF